MNTTRRTILGQVLGQGLAAGGLLASGREAGAAEPATGLKALLSDGPDGVLSAGMIVRKPGGKLAAAEAAGLRYTGEGKAERIQAFGLDDPFRTA